MRILFGVQGTGNGHISRSRTLARALKSRGMAVDYLFSGRAADGYFEPGIYVWDMAAADLILRQAGGAGSVLREFGGHKLAYVASNGILHDFLRGILEPCF